MRTTTTHESNPGYMYSIIKDSVYPIARCFRGYNIFTNLQNILVLRLIIISLIAYQIRYISVPPLSRTAIIMV